MASLDDLESIGTSFRLPYIPIRRSSFERCYKRRKSLQRSDVEDRPEVALRLKFINVNLQ